MGDVIEFGDLLLLLRVADMIKWIGTPKLHVISLFGFRETRWLEVIQQIQQRPLIHGIKPLKKIAKTLMYHSHGLLNYYFYRISCGLVEGINNKIKTLKRQAYGFQDMAYFKLRLYHLHSQVYSLTG